MNNTATPTVHATPHHPAGDSVRSAIAKRSFATLATTSEAGRPHVAGVLYAAVDDVLYVSTLRSSRKARNIAANDQVALVIPVRRIPVGPPSTVQFQTTAHLLAADDPEISTLAASGEIASITGHGELDLPDGCFIRIPLPKRAVTYGLGMSLRSLATDPLAAGGAVDLSA